MTEFIADMIADGTAFTFGAIAIVILVAWAWDTWDKRRAG